MALLPPPFLKAVVSIEIFDKSIYKPIGTGFIYADVIEKNSDGYRVREYLVTAKHVIYAAGLDISMQRQEVYLRFDRLGESGVQLVRLPLYQEGQAIFSFPSGDLDVAVIRLHGALLKEHDIDFISILDTETALREEKFEEVGLSTGDEVFFLGFPLGMRGEEKNYAICRGGMIARLDREALKNHVIYLDAPVFPGNSGGPVFCKPQATHIEGTKPIKNAYLLGLVTKYLAKNANDESAFTEADMRRLEGHLGLSKILTVDAIDLAIQEHDSRFPPAKLAAVEGDRV